MTDKINYLYFHISLETGDVVYVGTGSGGRAWASSKTHRRNAAHRNWLASMDEQGLTPDQYVSIEYKNFNRALVLKKEQECIAELSPVFNYTGKWDWCLSLSDDQITLSKLLREEGMGYKAIAKEVGSSAMTVFRLLNNKTKGYND